MKKLHLIQTKLKEFKLLASSGFFYFNPKQICINLKNRKKNFEPIGK